VREFAELGVFFFCEAFQRQPPQQGSVLVRQRPQLRHPRPRQAGVRLRHAQRRPPPPAGFFGVGRRRRPGPLGSGQGGFQLVLRVPLLRHFGPKLRRLRFPGKQRRLGRRRRLLGSRQAGAFLRHGRLGLFFRARSPFASFFQVGAKRRGLRFQRTQRAFRRLLTRTHTYE
jgi:hypothetical protein